MKRSRRESPRRIMVGPTQAISNFKDYFLILWTTYNSNKERIGERKQNQRRKVEERRKRRNPT